MRKFLVTGLVFISCLGTTHAAFLLPYLIPIRGEITSQLALLSADTNATNTAEIRALTQARNTLSRRGRTSLQNDLQMLSTLSVLLSRGDLNTTFGPLLDTAVSNYLATLEATTATVETNINTLPPSDQRAAMQTSLDFIEITLDQAASASNPTDATRAMSRAAVRLIALQSVTARLSRDATRRPELRAFVGSETFSADNPTATYSPGTGFVSINGTQTRGGETRSLSFTISDMRAGTTVHQLGDSTSSSYVIYTRRGTNLVGYTSTSGNVIVTLDAAAQTMTGTFSFNGTSRAGLDAPVQVSGGTFFLRYR